MNRTALAEDVVWISIARAAKILECSHDTVRRFAIEEGRLTYRQLRPGGWIKVSYNEVMAIRQQTS